VPPTLADRVRHILEAIREIDKALAEVDYERFSTDRFLRSGIERLLKIICEASKYIPQDMKRAHLEIDWQKLTAFGNRLRHAYHNIDAEIVWQIPQDDLPRLKRVVEEIMRDAGETL
jgi:uncharacterized protein with HEPN domain